MIETIRITTGRENSVVESLTTRIQTTKTPIKAIFRSEELRGYVFIEGEEDDIETIVKNIPHVRGLINRDIKLNEIEKFMISEQRTIEINIGDIIEIIGGNFKGEKGKVTRIDTTKQQITVEFIEAVIPIPVTVSINSVTMYEKKQE